MLTVRKPVLPVQSAHVPLCVPLPGKPVGLAGISEVGVELELVFAKSAGTEGEDGSSSGLWLPNVGMAGVGVTVMVLTRTVVVVTVTGLQPPGAPAPPPLPAVSSLGT